MTLVYIMLAVKKCNCWGSWEIFWLFAQFVACYKLTPEQVYNTGETVLY